MTFELFGEIANLGESKRSYTKVFFDAITNLPNANTALKKAVENLSDKNSLKNLDRLD